LSLETRRTPTSPNFFSTIFFPGNVKLRGAKLPVSQACVKTCPETTIVPMLIPKEGVRYQEQYSERFVEIRRETVNFLKTVIAR
jgi:hypothetical protein